PDCRRRVAMRLPTTTAPPPLPHPAGGIKKAAQPTDAELLALRGVLAPVPYRGEVSGWGKLYLPLLPWCQAARLSRRSEAARISRSVPPGRRPAWISSPSTSRRHARRLSAWLGRRAGSSHGDADRSATRSTDRPHAQASVRV